MRGIEFLVKHKCLGCTERKVGCHSTCESWKEYELEKNKKYHEVAEAYERREQLYQKEYTTYKEYCRSKGKKQMSISEYRYYLTKKDWKYKNIAN